MTTDDIISKAFRMFDEETDSKYEQDGDRTTALDYANDGYWDICLETKCSRSDGALTTVSGTRETALPSGKVGVIRIGYPSGDYWLKAIFADKQSVNQTGLPTQYYVEGGYIGFDVIPNGAYTFAVKYADGPTSELTLTDEPSLIPEIWQPKVLPYFITWKLFLNDKREEISSRAPAWEARYRERVNKMKIYFNTGQYAGKRPNGG